LPRYYSYIFPEFQCFLCLGISISESQPQPRQVANINDPTAAPPFLPRRLRPETETSPSVRIETIGASSASGRSVLSSGSGGFRPQQYAYRYLDSGPALYSHANTGTVYRTVLTTQTTVTSTLSRDFPRPRASATYIPPRHHDEDEAVELSSAGSGTLLRATFN